MTNDDILKSITEDHQFKSLWDGTWQNRFPSQSEADLALCAILSRYTKCPQQIKTLFMQSYLAENIKRKNDPEKYLLDPKYGIITKALNAEYS